MSPVLKFKKYLLSREGCIDMTVLGVVFDAENVKEEEDTTYDAPGFVW